jgi:hypothetical protein
MDISFDCDKCGKHLVIDEAGAGITIDCPGCGKPVYVPAASSPEPQLAPVRVEVASTSREATSGGTPTVENKRSTTDSRRTESPPFVSTRYRTLRAIAAFYEVLAVIVGFIAAFALLVTILTTRFMGGLLVILQAVGTILFGAIGIVVCLATAEGIRLAIDIEENTRATRLMLEQRFFSAHRDASPVADEPPHTSHAADQSPKSSGRAQFSGSSSSW